MSEEGSGSGSVLVIGGGVAGMTAATMLAGKGRRVHLIEREAVLGGLVARHGVAAPGHEAPAALLDELRGKVEGDERISVHLSTTLKALAGKVRDFRATIDSGGTTTEIDVGAVVVATGAVPFDPSALPEYKYGRSPSIVTSIEMEGILGQEGLSIPGGQRQGQVRVVGFVQCVGSRMATRGNPWCSNICCMATLKQALEVRRRSPDTSVTVFYMDIRAFGRGQEELYDEAKVAGVRFLRGIPSEVLVLPDGAVRVRAEDASLGKVLERDLDLLVLAVGLQPASGAEDLVKALGLEASGDGFVPIASPERRPCCTAVEGIMVAGTAEFPKGIKETVLQARSAALVADLRLGGN